MRTGSADPRWVIAVKAGTYRERLYVQRERGRMAIVGEEAARTVITYDQASAGSQAYLAAASEIAQRGVAAKGQS